MQVILLEKNHKLGDLGDIANVKSGYARNYLIPQGKAKPATKENLAEFELIKAELEKKEVAALADAQAKESEMTDITCNIAANAGEIVSKTQSPPIVQVNKYQQNLVFITVNLLSLPFFFTRRNKNKPRRTAHIHTKETNNRPLKSISGLLKIANPRTARYDIEPVRSK